MMTSLNYSEYNIDEPESINNFEKSKFNTQVKHKNHTMKRKRNVTNLLKTMHANRNKIYDDEEEDENELNTAYLGNVQLPPPPQMTTINENDNITNDNVVKLDTNINQENFTDNTTETYTRQYVPYYNGESYQSVNKDQMMEKMNYMIHLLEEQKDEKSNSVIEELILYGFLGIFMIFMVDSFSKVGGKYTR